MELVYLNFLEQRAVLFFSSSISFSLLVTILFCLFFFTSDSYFACLHLFEALSLFFFYYYYYLDSFFIIVRNFLFFELGFDFGAKWGLFYLSFPYFVLTFSSFSLLFYVFISVAFLSVTTSARGTEVFGGVFITLFSPLSFSLPDFLFFSFLLTGARAFFHPPFYPPSSPSPSPSSSLSISRAADKQAD